jgi:hypothetical protein
VSDDGRCVQVDEGLEALLADVESAVVTYVVRITEDSRRSLADALDALDAATRASDDFRSKEGAAAMLVGFAGLGTSPLDVVGQTSKFPVVNEVPRPVFKAQVTLVRAAKDEVHSSSPQTLEALNGANGELAAMRSRYVR